MTSSEIAAWVQAIGSIVAIGGAVWAALWQARAHHQNALGLLRAEQRYSRIELAKALYVLASNCSRAMAHISGQLSSREGVSEAAEGRQHLDRGELARLDAAIAAIPLHSLPSALVTPTMVVGGVMRQFAEQVDLVLKAYRSMDGPQFEEFFRVIGEMDRSLSATCDDISRIVTRLEQER